MIVLADVGGVDPPPPRHSQVKYQRVAAIGLDQPIFGTTAKRGDPRPDQPLAKIDRHRPAEIGAARLDPHEPTPLEHLGQPAHGGFDFGKFGHPPPMASRRLPR